MLHHIWMVAFFQPMVDEKEKVDIVVMAGRGGKEHFRIGGATEKVVKNSPVPV